MDQIENICVNSPEEEPSHSSSSTHLSSDFDSQSADSSAQSTSCEISANSSELRALGGSYLSFDDDNMHEEVTGVELLMEKIRIPHILSGIFRLLDKDSLRQARLVSSKWNDVALEIMSKTAGTVQFCFQGENGLDAKELGRIKKLLCILNNTENPGMFFTKLILVTPEGINRYSPHGVLVQECHLLNLLSKFGSTLKSLELRCITIHLSILRPILEIWCVNLEELILDDFTVIEDSIVSVQSFETTPTPLNLNLRKIRVYENYHYVDYSPNFICSIIKSSPKLQSFHGFPIQKESEFWKKIGSLPSIRENLEELIIGSCGVREISWLNNISFCNKLTSLTLDIRQPSIPKEQLVAFLKTVAKSLVKFGLHMSMLNWEQDDNTYWKLELPLMTKLKVLEHSADFAEPACFHSIDVLERCPNLEILRMAGSIDGSPIYNTDMDDFFLKSSYLISHPHTTLKNLCIEGSPLSLETIPAINQMFPNLCELSLHFDMYEIPETTDKETWLTSNFKRLSEMKNLNILKVHFHESFKLDLGINFLNCFSPLEASKSLQKLTIGRYQEPNEDIPSLPPDFLSVPPMFVPHRQDFPLGLAEIFGKIPNLKVLTLQGFQIGSSDSEIVFKSLDQKGILLLC